MSVFLCHASDDKAAVRRLAMALREAGFSPWLDEESLLPGQDWELEITRAVRGAAAVIVCLSRAAVSKTGYVQKEVRFALDVADRQPEGTIFIIPCKLADVEVPERLRRWQWVDIREPRGLERLTAALKHRYGSLNKAPSPAFAKAPPSPGPIKAPVTQPVGSEALSRDPIGKKIIEIVVEHLHIQKERITASSTLEDLQADSLDEVEMVMAMEEAFGIEIPDEDAQTITTVGQAIEYVRRHAGSRK